MRRFLRELRRYAGQFVTNWREYDASFFAKLRLAFRNRLRALFRPEQCCGHLGEPGC
ncbi:MAG TPA: hypothetical protein VJ913_06775 [Actinomycetota bacterium]|nr:hypothetical protein [Actinomycetota bacterium]